MSWRTAYSEHTIHPPMATMTTQPNKPRSPLPPWVYVPGRGHSGDGLILHDEHKCHACHEYGKHYRRHGQFKEPSFLAARLAHRERVEKAVSRAREEKAEEIADLTRKLEETRRELEEVRKDKVSFSRGTVLRMLTATCSASSRKSSSATLSLSPTHPARIRSHAANSTAHAQPPPSTIMSPQGTLPHLVQVHHASRER
jgi:hypothetical protein